MTYRTHMEEGLRAAQANNPVQALSLFQAACRLQPSDVPAQLNRGHMALLINDTTEAADAFSTALKLDPGSEQALLGMVKLYLQQARWSEARNGIEQHPVASTGQGAYLLAIACEGLADISAAAQALRLAHKRGVPQAAGALRRLLAQHDPSGLAREVATEERLSPASVVPYLHQIAETKKVWIFVAKLMELHPDRVELADVAARWFLEREAYAYAARVSGAVRRAQPALDLSCWPGLKECAWLP